MQAWQSRRPAPSPPQNNHIFMSVYAVFKLECLKINLNLNHFAMRAKLLIQASQMVYEELQRLRVV
ncbi:MAG: hypothetical protein PHR16_14770 [Methylovulum sp.]|nr:hypothetical protein [Methylovulum sp.]